MNHLLPLFISILIAVAPACYGDGVNEQFAECNGTSKCGLLEEIGYPFWGNNSRPRFCGRQGFELQCNKENTNPTIQMGSQSFQVLQINDPKQTITIKITAAGISESQWCSLLFQRPISIDDSLFSYTEDVGNLSLFFNCGGESSSTGNKNRYSCPSAKVEFGFYKFDDDSLNGQLRLGNLSNSCSFVTKFPVQLTLSNPDLLSEGKLQEVLNGGFEVKYSADDEGLCTACLSSKGLCGSNQNTTKFACLCRDEEPQASICPPPPPTSGMISHPFPVIFISRI